MERPLSHRRPTPAATFAFLASLALLIAAASPRPAAARPEFREAFFLAYPSATGTVLDNVPSNSVHCGVCHFRFNGGGPRNPFGVAVQNRLPNYPDTPEGRRDAILSLEGIDSDGDGHANGVEVTDTVHYANTPTFPGLHAGNVGNVSQVNVSEIIDHLTPATGQDTTPPTVTVLAPAGGETWIGHAPNSITWTATDASGVVRVEIHFSTNGGVTFAPLALDTPNDGTFTWFVQDFPGAQNLVRVDAWDAFGNRGQDASNAPFTIAAPAIGRVATTLRDFELPGTQPLGAGTIQSYGECTACHGGYDPGTEPEFMWKGSMMAQAARDPLFFAALSIANQDARDSGDLCLRCHTQSGWFGGRSTPPSGSQLTLADREGVSCDICHGMVDPIYEPGVSPIEDQAILAALALVPPDVGSGMTVIDPSAAKRGPFNDATSPAHASIASPFHREAAMCGTCHNVSNPAFSAAGDDYVLNALDAAAPSFDPYDQFPVERTYGEWLMSEYNTPGGVYAPEFAGNLPGGRVSTCQDCHMRDVLGRGANLPEVPVRPDLPLHDMTGGNTWMAAVLADLYPGEVDPAALAAAADRALYMLEHAATLEVEAPIVDEVPVAMVTVTNQTGHKLPSGYPEGRRIWLNVRAFDAGNALVYESGAYNASTGELIPDSALRVYEADLGISPGLAAVLGLPPGPSFHFVLNDSIYKDNRIPPRGFTNAGFALVQATPVDPDWPGPGPRYADGQYWDLAMFELPISAARVEVALNYQTTSKEYVEFLRNENVTDGTGQVMYTAWEEQGRAAPVEMATAEASVGTTAAGEVPATESVFGLARSGRHPWVGAGTVVVRLAARGEAELVVVDVMGRRVRTLWDGAEAAAGEHRVIWDGRDEAGRRVPSGIYWVRLRSGSRQAVERLVLMSSSSR
jgi:hypothetical protein